MTRTLSLERTAPYLVVIAVLALSYWIGTQAWSLAGLSLSSNPVRLLAVLGVIALLAFAIQDLPRALTLLVIVAGVIDLPIGTGTESKINLAMILTALIAAAWLLKMLVQRRTPLLVASNVNRPLLLFIAVLLFSWLLGYALWDFRVMRPSDALRVQAGQVGVFVLCAAALLLGANVPLGERTLRIWTLVAIGVAVLGQAALVANLAKLPILAIVQPPLAIGFVLLLSQLLLNASLKPGLKLLGWATAAVWAVATVGTYRFSFVGSWLPIAAGAGLVLWFRSKRLFFFALVLGLVFLVVHPGPFLRELDIKSSSGSLLRPYIWWDIIRMTSRSPISMLFGLGPVNYKWDWSDPSFVSLSRYMTTGFEAGYAPPAHNMFIDIYAQTGLVGMALFASVLLAIGRIGLGLLSRVEPGFMRAYVAGVVAGFAGLAISSGITADWLIPFVYNIGLNGFRGSVYAWLLAGTLVGLYAQQRDRNRGARQNA
ncbi:MAG: hypothetical protein M1335_08005 [Chloroflexi bacterium]|nr:hypothetical protein [Chloroflexota bacterium]